MKKLTLEEMEMNVYHNLFEYPTKKIVKLETENEKLEKENKKLKERITKAVAYIKKTEFEKYINPKDLLKILTN